jgi:hypothetical protein
LSTSLGIEDQIKRLHASLGHPNLKHMKDIVKQSLSNPISGKLKQAILELETFFYDCCHQARRTQQKVCVTQKPLFLLQKI